jgi:ribokinase
MGKIVVIGSLNMDLVVNSPRMPKLGETLTGWGFLTCPGGKGSNQAVAAARLGGEVAMVGHVGADIFGDFLLKGLAADGVDHRAVERLPDAPTGTATIVVVGGDNLIILDPGANGRLTPERIEASEPLIREADLLMLQLEIPLETVRRAIGIARRHGVKVMLDPAPAVPLDQDLLRQVDIFKPNEHECQIATGLKADTLPDALQAVTRLHQTGIALPIVTLGPQGVVYYSGEDQKAVHVPACPARAVDTTAAGDSFSGALAVGLTSGMAVRQAIEFASRAAAVTISRPGAQPSLPRLSELDPA